MNNVLDWSFHCPSLSMLVAYFLNDRFSGSSSKNNTSEDHGDLNDPYVRLKRDCVGIMAAFRLKGPFDHVVILANTHLYW